MAKRPINLTRWQHTKRGFGLFKHKAKKLFRRRAKLIRKEKKPNLGLQGRASFENWFNGNDIARDAKGNLKVNVTDRLLGEGDYGKVFIGRVYFKDGTVKRVAVKIFHDALSEYDAAVYKEIIERLARAKAPIPKMQMLQIADPATGTLRWVQVSQLFGTEKRKKVGEKRHSLQLVLEATNVKPRAEIVNLYSSFINAGYVVPRDAVHYLTTQEGTRVIPIDLDLLVEQRDLVQNKKMFADAIVERFTSLALRYAAGQRTFKYLINGMLERVNDPELKAILERRLRPRNV